MATKTSSKKSKSRRPKVKTPVAERVQTLAELRQELQECQLQLTEALQREKAIASENVRLVRDLRESLEQQTATSEILGVIASSPTDTQPVLGVVAENAARLCEAADAAIWRADGDKFWLVASHGSIPISRPEEARPMTGSFTISRAMIDQKTIHIHDLSSTEAQTEFPQAWALSRAVGIRTALITPLIREGVANRSDSNPPTGSSALFRKANLAS